MFSSRIECEVLGKEERIISIESGGEVLLPPDNMGEIIFLKSGKIEVSILGKVKAAQCNDTCALVLFPRSRGIRLVAEDPSSVWILKLHPLYMKRVVVDLTEVTQGVFALDDCPSSGSLMDRIYALLDSTDLFDFNSAMDDVLMETMDRIHAENGNITVRALHEGLGISKSTLEQYFLKRIGLAPKEYCRIQKLAYFLACYQKYDTYSLTELAHHCGYYDQSHLIKEFRFFLEMSPRNYFKTANSIVEVGTIY